MDCRSCEQKIKSGERSYYSRQAGMQGPYHWACYIESCRIANRAGANAIENITVSEEAFSDTVYA